MRSARARVAGRFTSCPLSAREIVEGETPNRSESSFNVLLTGPASETTINPHTSLTRDGLTIPGDADARLRRRDGVAIRSAPLSTGPKKIGQDVGLGDVRYQVIGGRTNLAIDVKRA
jgi:hypothetical protein